MIMGKSSITRQLIAAFSACLSSLAGAFHTGWASPSLVKLEAEDSDLPITSAQGSWIVSIFVVSVALGALITSFTANRWGRKPSLLAMAIPVSVACILVATAQNYWWLIIARFIVGVGAGGSSPIVLMYLGEIADDRIRGAIGVLFNLMSNSGILLAYCVGPWVSRAVLAYVGLSLPIIFAVTFIGMPESPYLLIMKNRIKDAEKSLTWLRGTSDVEDEVRKIEDNVGIGKTGTFKELIMTPGNRKALMLVTLLMLASQLSGITAILSYTGLIFEASGSDLSSSISVIICGMVQLIGGGLSIFTVDLIGRRPLLMLSSFGSITFLLAEALYFQFQSIGTDVSSISWLPITAIIGYLISYSIGLGCVPFVVLTEILPCNLKAVAMMYAFFIIAFSGMAVTKLYQVIADAYGIHACFYVFVACSVLVALFIHFFLPETKQKSFRVIQDELRGLRDYKKAIQADNKL